MKKKILGGIAIVAIVAITALNINFSTQNNDLSMIGLANVEALAQSESGGYSGCRSGGGYCAIYMSGSCIFSSYSHYPY